MLIGGEDLPKVSTQALKQQYEKTIEEATPVKEIKVMMLCVYLKRYYVFMIFRWCQYMKMGTDHKAIKRKLSMP